MYLTSIAVMAARNIGGAVTRAHMHPTHLRGHPMNAPIPMVGDWFRRSGGELFEVVAVDEDDATIEVQHFDGTVEEIDFDSWDEQWEEAQIEAAEAPEDWTGSVDVEPEDTEQTSDSNSERQWLSPLDYFDDQR
jgi:hypothetical protein